MDFHGIDCKGELKLEIVASLPTPYDPSYERRILYNDADKKLYYGTDTEWIDLADAAHIAQTQAHGSDGDIVGATTLSNAISAHSSLTETHGSDGDIVGATTLSNAISAHASSVDHPLATELDKGLLPQLPNDPTLFLNGLGLWDHKDAIRKTINQPLHGLALCVVVRFDGTTNTYIPAQSDNVINAEALGVITEIIDDDNFVITTSGYCDFSPTTLFNDFDLIYGYAGVYYLDPVIEGYITKTEPTTIGQISKPVFIAIDQYRGYFVNQRGIEIPAEGISSNVSVINTINSTIITTNVELTLDGSGIPIDSGGVFLMSSTITPKSSSSTIVIDITIPYTTGGTNFIPGAALFISGQPTALVVGTGGRVWGVGGSQIKLKYIRTSGTTNPLTFTIRVGQLYSGGSSPVWFNASFNGLGAIFNCVDRIYSSMTITEF
jgi:hypothetical protein